PLPDTDITRLPCSFLLTSLFTSSALIEKFPTAAVNESVLFFAGNGFTVTGNASVLTELSYTSVLLCNSLSAVLPSKPSTISCSVFLLTSLLENSTLLDISIGSITYWPACKGYN